MLRDFTEEDQAAVRDLVVDGMRQRWGDAFDPAFNMDVEDIAANYVLRGAAVIVVEVGGHVVATGTLLQDRDGQGRIVRVAVAGAHRRRGLGRLVVDELVRRARCHGMTEVRVLTDTPWMSAVELYRTSGFMKVAEDHKDVHFVMHL